MSETIDLLIADTVGNHLTDEYRSYLPNVEMIGYPHPDEPDVNYPVHNHGAWCGWLAGLPCQVETILNPAKKFRLHFVPMFRPNGRPYKDSMLFLMEHIQKIRPRILSRSFGSWDRDNSMSEMILRSIYQEYAADWHALQQDVGFLDFAAAGNNDENDADNDIAAPQRYMDKSLIVGSVNRRGIPSVFSGDGEKVLCAMWGEKVISLGLDGRWHLWSGTSATCPKLAGVAAAMGLRTRQEVVDLVKKTATYPTGFDRPHPKWGWGCCEELWQKYTQKMPPTLWPSCQSALILDHAHEVF